MRSRSFQDVRPSSIEQKERPTWQPIPTRKWKKRCGQLFIMFFFGAVTVILVFSARAFAARSRQVVPGEGNISTPNLQSAPRVTLPQGTLVGTSVTISKPQVVIEEFLGVRYALQPLGAQRFKPPLPIGKSNSTFDVTQYGSICVQVGGTLSSSESEDCLYLNIFRPAGTLAGQKLPVAAYIHGGAFVSGSGTDRDIATMIAVSSEPMIGVSINYRLGALGFMSSGLMAREGALNLGLKDQLIALQWLNQNIESFGGDSNKVTLMGESAGGHSIGHHLQGPASKGLFRQVIMESGAPTARFCQPAASSLNEQQFNDFLNASGIDASNLSDNGVLSALRALSVSTVKNVATNVYNKYGPSDRWAFQPVIDGSGGIIPSDPLSIWTSGTWNKVPILTGFCTDEGAPFVPLTISTSQQFTDFFQALNPAWNTTDIHTINSLYPDPLTDPTSPYKQTQKGAGAEHDRIMAAYGQFAYIAPVRQSASFASASSNPPVYLYHVKLNSSIISGTSHACVGGYVAYNAAIVGTSSSLELLATAINAYWTNFIANGNPNVGARNPQVAANAMAVWPAYMPNAAGHGAKKMVFGAGNDERVGGTHVGILTQNVTETEFITESNFWWARTILTEI